MLAKLHSFLTEITHWYQHNTGCLVLYCSRMSTALLFFKLISFFSDFKWGEPQISYISFCLKQFKNNSWEVYNSADWFVMFHQDRFPGMAVLQLRQLWFTLFNFCDPNDGACCTLSRFSDWRKSRGAGVLHFKGMEPHAVHEERAEAFTQWGRTPCTSTCWGYLAEKKLVVLFRPWASNVALQWRRPTASWLAGQREWPAGQTVPLLSISVTDPDPGTQLQGRHGHVCSESSKGPWRRSNDWSSWQTKGG